MHGCNLHSVERNLFTQSVQSGPNGKVRMLRGGSVQCTRRWSEGSGRVSDSITETMWEVGAFSRLHAARHESSIQKRKQRS
eukprot:2544793-Rhodomonas_salina.3